MTKLSTAVSIGVFAVVLALSILLVTLINDDPRELLVKEIRPNVFYYQITTFTLGLLAILYYHSGKRFGKLVSQKVSYNPKHIQSMDFDFSILLVLAFSLSLIHFLFNRSLYDALFQYVGDEYRYVYHFTYQMLGFIILQLGLCVVSFLAFLLSYMGELKDKKSDKRPWRWRDMWFELLGWKEKVIYWDSKEHHEELMKPIGWKKWVALILIFSILLLGLILDILGLFP